MVLKILVWPNAKLQIASNRVVNPVNPTFIESLFQTMNFYGGAGLSAIQIGIPEQVVVARVTKPEKTENYVWINPTWTPVEGVQPIMMAEGCLSTPGQFDFVSRYPTVNATWQDPTTLAKMEGQLDGLAAQVMQHEYEHLEGKMFVDHLTSASRSRIKGAMIAYKKRNP